MVKRKAMRIRRPRKSFSLVNAVFSLGYANIISTGLFGANIAEFFLGRTSAGYGAMGFVSGRGIGIRELITDPSSLGQIQANLASNLPDMLIKSLTLGVTERVFKQVMRKPLGNVNRNIVKPLLGAGVKL
jgi:hypothetical protein